MVVACVTWRVAPPLVVATASVMTSTCSSSVTVPVVSAGDVVSFLQDEMAIVATTSMRAATLRMGALNVLFICVCFLVLIWTF